MISKPSAMPSGRRSRVAQPTFPDCFVCDRSFTTRSGFISHVRSKACREAHAALPVYIVSARADGQFETYCYECGEEFLTLDIDLIPWFHRSHDPTGRKHRG